MTMRNSVSRLAAFVPFSIFTLLSASPAAAAPPPEPYVLVSTDASIYKFDLQGNSLGRLIEPGDPGEAAPQHMAVGSDGNLYVANFRGGLQVYDLQTGDHVRTVRTGRELVNAAYMTIRDDVLIVSTFGTDRVLRYDLNNNDALLPDLFPAANVRDPHHILWLDNGEMLASMGTQVSRFAADGSYLGAFTTENISTATSKVILGDSLIVNNFGGTTQRYDLATGAYQGVFNLDQKGDEGGDGVITLPDGTVILAFNTSKTVRWYDADGNFLKVFGSKAEMNFEGPNGILYVVPAAPTAGLMGMGLLLVSRRRR